MKLQKRAGQSEPVEDSCGEAHPPCFDKFSMTAAFKHVIDKKRRPSTVGKAFFFFVNILLLFRHQNQFNQIFTAQVFVGGVFSGLRGYLFKTVYMRQYLIWIFAVL
ncbi:hypothetical protein SAMN05192574_11561 [Mucilaginibacter gossypiicola]|uniref:Uncharacterized protein n=1 Tax=Mucilaginibacter gossypiicola TaxID=551995 RepID=A0A1H8TDI1_9SPHI|nr:hypothetical protein SAMN05192574_11561 [Mucilaginibacter gossypiicola]